MELNERLTGGEIRELIWGLQFHGNRNRTLAGLVELQERRAKDVAIEELLSAFQNLSAACDTGERRGDGSQSGVAMPDWTVVENARRLLEAYNLEQAK